MATSPLPSWGRRSERNCYVTAAFSGVPQKGDKIRRGYITPAFSGAQKWAERLHNPCLLGGPQKKGTKMANVRPLQKGPLGVVLDKKKKSGPLRAALLGGLSQCGASTLECTRTLLMPTISGAYVVMNSKA